MGNEENGINIRISYNDNIKDIKCNKDKTIKDLLSEYIKECLNPGYNVNKFTVKLNNNKKCSPNDTIETYIKDINNNSIFYLIYDNNKQNIEVKNQDDDDDFDEDFKY